MAIWIETFLSFFFPFFFFFGFQLGGAVNRQDFKCHLDKDGQYSRAKEYDYPSLAEISRLLQDHKVNLIFAVTEDRREEYELISDLLKEKARVATLADSSSNILEIIESSYHEIVSKLVLRDNSSEPLKLEYFSNCGKEDGESIIVNKAECDGIQEGQVYEFKVVFSMGSCPRNESLWVSKWICQRLSKYSQIFYIFFFSRVKKEKEGEKKKKGGGRSKNKWTVRFYANRSKVDNIYVTFR